MNKKSQGKKSKRKPKKYQIIEGLKYFGNTGQKLNVKHVNNLLQGYDFNVCLEKEVANSRLEEEIKFLRKCNNWLRKKLDTTYLSQNSYVKKVRANFENYEKSNAELKEENSFIRKKLIGQYKHFKNFDCKHRKDN